MIRSMLPKARRLLSLGGLCMLLVVWTLISLLPQVVLPSWVRTPRPNSIVEGLLSSLGFGAWAQRSLRAAASFCSSTIRSPVMVTQGLITSHEPMLSLGSPHVDGTLGTVGSQGWAMRAPPRPDEAGPSN